MQVKRKQIVYMCLNAELRLSTHLETFQYHMFKVIVSANYAFD